MIAVVHCLVGTFCSILSTHRVLALENLALRHQLLILQRNTRGRIALTPADRLLWFWLAGSWRGWRQTLIVRMPSGSRLDPA